MGMLDGTHMLRRLKAAAHGRAVDEQCALVGCIRSPACRSQGYWHQLAVPSNVLGYVDDVGWISKGSLTSCCSHMELVAPHIGRIRRTQRARERSA